MWRHCNNIVLTSSKLSGTLPARCSFTDWLPPAPRRFLKNVSRPHLYVWQYGRLVATLWQFVTYSSDSCHDASFVVIFNGIPFPVTTVTRKLVSRKLLVSGEAPRRIWEAVYIDLNNAPSHMAKFAFDWGKFGRKHTLPLLMTISMLISHSVMMLTNFSRNIPLIRDKSKNCQFFCPQMPIFMDFVKVAGKFLIQTHSWLGNLGSKSNPCKQAAHLQNKCPWRLESHMEVNQRWSLIISFEIFLTMTS